MRHVSMSGTDIRMIVLAGQSNAQGWMGEGRDFRKEPGDETIPFRWVILGHNSMLAGESQHSKGWETLGPQEGICGYGNPAPHFGPEIQLARTLASAGTRIAIVKTTIGASSLYGDWRLPGQGGLTDAMLDEVAEAMNELRKSGRNARLRGFVWIQGESDADTDEHARGYQGLLTELIAKLRRQWQEPGLPVVLGLDEQHPGPTARPLVVEAQRGVAGADPLVAWTSMRGLEKADVSHLANAGLLKHGERLAAALSRLWEAENKEYALRIENDDMIRKKRNMNSRERFFATLNHQPADRAPANYFAKTEVTQALIQYLGVADEEALLRRFKVDFRRVGCSYELPMSAPDGEGYSRNMWGTRCKTRPDGTVHYLCPFNEDSTVDDVEAHEWPDAGRVDVSHVRAACAKHHDEFVVFGAPWCPFFHEVGWFIGQENFLMWMMLKPDVIEAIIRHMVDFEIAVLRRFLEAADGKLDMTYFGNDFGTQRGLFIGLDLWKQFMREPLKRFYDVSHEYGCKVMQHSCGSICELIPLWIEDGVDILDPIQVQATGMEFEKLVAEYGDRITLNGAVDMQVTLPRGTPEDVRREVKRYLAATRNRGGYILCPGQELLPEVPLENIVAMYDANDYNSGE